MRLSEVRDKAEKWKERCRQMGHQLAAATAAASAREAAGGERVAEAERQLDRLVGQHKAEMHRWEGCALHTQLHTSVPD